MKRKETRAILQGLGVGNRFSLKTVGFCRETRQVLTVKDWRPGPLATTIKAAFAAKKILVDFTGPPNMGSVGGGG